MEHMMSTWSMVEQDEVFEYDLSIPIVIALKASVWYGDR